MTRDEAFKKATSELGAGAFVGLNHQYPAAPCHVGVKASGDWKKFGAGATWEEAFANVKEVEHRVGNGRFVFKDGTKT